MEKVGKRKPSQGKSPASRLSSRGCMSTPVFSVLGTNIKKSSTSTEHRLPTLLSLVRVRTAYWKRKTPARYMLGNWQGCQGLERSIYLVRILISSASTREYHDGH